MSRASNYYADVCPQPPYRVLGLPLLPLSAGHLLRLYQLESPFVLGGVPTIEDLVLGVLVCSRNYQQSGQALTDPALPKEMLKWQKRISRSGWFKPVKIDYSAKIKLFIDYIEDGTQTPNYWSQSTSSTADNHCPSVLFVLNDLERVSNWTRAELIDRPWKETMWDWLTHKLIDGKITAFIDDDAATQIDQAVEAGTALAKSLGWEGPCRQN